MAKKNVWKTLAGLAVVGAAVGGAIAYVKKCKDVNDLSEEDFDDLLNEEKEETCENCQAERTYTTLHPESETVEKRWRKQQKLLIRICRKQKFPQKKRLKHLQSNLLALEKGVVALKRHLLFLFYIHF